MKKLFLIIAVMFSLVFVSSDMVFAGDESDAFRAAVKEIYKIYSEATVKKDVDAWIALWDEKGVKMVPNRPAIYGKSAIGKLKLKKAKKWEYLSSDIEMEDTQVAGDYGFAHGTYSGSRKPIGEGTTTFAEGKFLTIFKKQADGSWKIYRDSVSPNPLPK